jgi:hypothetical protein
MLSSDDHPGIFYFMGGMIVLVMVSVGFSVIVDGRVKASRGIGAAQREMKSDAEELAYLTNLHLAKSSELASRGSTVQTQSSAHAQLRRGLEQLRGRRAELESVRGGLQGSISTLETEFLSYRASYRNRAWTNAIGEKLGTLKVRGGREYQDAVITLVTEVGIQIRHKDGFARIEAPDLDSQWQDRFQWNDRERISRLKEEADTREKIAQVSKPEGSSPPNPRAARNAARQAAAEVDKEKTAQARSQYLGWRSKVNKLFYEKEQAASNAAYSGRASVPGSLETWQAKAARLTTELAKARVGLDLARSRLAEIAPHDSLLREPEPGSVGEY